MFNFSKYFISLFGIGFMPLAPGTFGTLISLILLFTLIKYISIFYLILLFAVLFLISLFAIKYYCMITNKHDASEIVIDEFLGVFLIVIFYDYIKFYNDIVMLLMIFLFFRFFDIFKPFPANWVDKNMINSLGIILDDIIAALYCLLTLLIINAFI
jgi:phosphatidylglycerophosphatase A